MTRFENITEYTVSKAIKQLCEKGYLILTSSVHHDSIRITFYDGVILPNIPEGFSHANDGKHEIIANCHIGVDDTLLGEKIDKDNLELLKWILTLPRINNEKKGYGLWEKIKRMIKMTR